MKVEAVVLANGEYPTAPLPLQILADAPYVVCCDGGADEYIRNGHTPNLIIGDGDSISEENRKKYGHLLHRIAETSACLWTICVQEPMYGLIQITASSSLAGTHVLLPANRDSKYPSSTSMPVNCMGSAWYTLSATSPTGGRALSTNASEQSLRLRRKGSIWFF